MPINIQHAQLPDHFMPLQHLQRHNPRITHHIAHHLTVEDLHCPIIARVRKERVAPTGVELDGPDGLLVIAECLVGAR